MILIQYLLTWLVLLYILGFNTEHQFSIFYYWMRVEQPVTLFHVSKQ